MPPRENAAPAATMESYFRDVAAMLDGLVQAGETYTACFSAECSDFVRMNRGKVRQPGSVVQRYLGIDLDPRRTPCDLPALADRRRGHGSRRDRGGGRCFARRARRCRGRPAPADRDRGPFVARSARRTAAACGDDHRCCARCGARHRPGRPVRRRAGVSRLREFARPAQLARGARVQLPVEPLPPRRQGGEVGVVRLRLGRRVHSPRRWTRPAPSSRT